MNNNGTIKKQTFYLSIIAALLIGFLGGVAYCVYRTPEGGLDPQEVAQQQEAVKIIANLEKATLDKPSDYQAWVELGHAYFDTGQAKQAIRAYTKALELMPGDLDVMPDLAVMYHQDKQHQKAIAVLDQVLASNPKHEQARFNKGVVLLTGLNDRAAALAEWKKLVSINPLSIAPSGTMVTELIEQLEKEKAQPAQ